MACGWTRPPSRCRPGSGIASIAPTALPSFLSPGACGSPPPGRAPRHAPDRLIRMEYRTLGRSGCAVSAYCLGTMTFGSETDEAGAFEQLDRFVEAGGTLVDTADVYSGGASEQIIGRWFASRPAEVTEPVV